MLNCPLLLSIHGTPRGLSVCRVQPTTLGFGDESEAAVSIVASCRALCPGHTGLSGSDSDGKRKEETERGTVTCLVT